MAAQFEFDHVSVAETELILQSLDPNKATGHDQIPAHVLQDGASVWLLLLHDWLTLLLVMPVFLLNGN